MPGLIEFARLLNLLPQASLLWDHSRDQILLANSEFLKMTAFTQSELVGHVLKDFFPDIAPQDLSIGGQVFVMVNRHTRSPISGTLNCQVIDDESHLWLLTCRSGGSEHFLQDGLIYRYLAKLAHLTELPSLEDALKEVVRLAKEMLGVGHVCIYKADVSYPRLCKYISEETDPKFPDELPSTDLIRLSDTNIWSPGRRMLAEIHRIGRVENFSYVATTPIGQEGACLGLLVVGEAEKECPDQLAYLLDILGARISNAFQHYLLSENLLNEVTKQEQQLYIFKNLMENTSEGIIILDPYLGILDMNPSAEVMLGYAHTELHGHSAESVLIGAENILPTLAQASQGIPTHNLGNVSLHNRSGQSFPAHIQILPVMRESDVLAILIYIQDVSEHEQIQIRTQQLEHRAFLGEFTAIFAHEVRNPINNISTGLQLMANRLPVEDQNQDVINRMQGDCTRLNHLMESILSFSRQNEHKYEPVDLVFLLQRILDRWRPRCSRVNVIQYYQASGEIPSVKGDARALEQVFTNLISNAVEAMSNTGGTLSIKLGLSDEIVNLPQVEVTVSDNGPGISDEVKEHIFEPFVTTNPRGNGLGLAITKQIITAHRGTIKVNTFPGGTVFHVLLPAIPKNIGDQ